MKKTILLVIKIILLILIIAWMGFLVTDYFRAKGGNKPIICLSEKTITKKNASYYQCTSLGYSYYEYNKDNVKTFGFGAAFLKNSAEKEIGEMNE